MASEEKSREPCGSYRREINVSASASFCSVRIPTSLLHDEKICSTVRCGLFSAVPGRMCKIRNSFAFILKLKERERLLTKCVFLEKLGVYTMRPFRVAEAPLSHASLGWGIRPNLPCPPHPCLIWEQVDVVRWAGR